MSCAVSHEIAHLILQTLQLLGTFQAGRDLLLEAGRPKRRVIPRHAFWLASESPGAHTSGALTLSRGIRC